MHDNVWNGWQETETHTEAVIAKRGTHTGRLVDRAHQGIAPDTEWHCTAAGVERGTLVGLLSALIRELQGHCMHERSHWMVAMDGCKRCIHILGTTPPRDMRRHAMYSSWREPHSIKIAAGPSTDMAISATKTRAKHRTAAGVEVGWTLTDRLVECAHLGNCEAAVCTSEEANLVGHVGTCEEPVAGQQTSPKGT